MSKQAYKRLRKRLKMEVNRNPPDAYAWPGGYPLFYLGPYDCIFCPDCAANKPDEVTACGVHWEGEPMRCDECNAEIESAYGNPDSEDTEPWSYRNG